MTDDERRYRAALALIWRELVSPDVEVALIRDRIERILREECAELSPEDAAMPARVQWFGVGWGAPINDSCEHVSVPVGASCGHCRRRIDHESSGLSIPSMSGRVPYHARCFARAVGVEVL